ncbi:toll/interleukin-1 receptor domain-containing protein [Burkholderia sp. R-69980]|nr:toll/interleukin-1 receptor domain-containing protein [Burkholderia sp. R-69980]
MTAIFISFRQDDAQPCALLLRDELADAFGAEHVFLDQDTLTPGRGSESIQHAFDRCKVVVVVMGRRWLPMTDASGERRPDNPDDVHRQYIAFALARKDIAVIPVRVEGAPMLRRDELPAELRSLTDHQSHAMSDSGEQRKVDLKVLVADIERLTGLVAKQRAPASSIQPRNAQRERAPSRFPMGTFAIAAIASVVLLVLAYVRGWTFSPQETSFIVLIVLLVTIGGRWLLHRATKGKHDET